MVLLVTHRKSTRDPPAGRMGSLRDADLQESRDGEGADTLPYFDEKNQPLLQCCKRFVFQQRKRSRYSLR